jgi:hypothetical protein
MRNRAGDNDSDANGSAIAVGILKPSIAPQPAPEVRKMYLAKKENDRLPVWWVPGCNWEESAQKRHGMRRQAGTQIMKTRPWKPTGEANSPVGSGEDDAGWPAGGQ